MIAPSRFQSSRPGNHEALRHRRGLAAIVAATALAIATSSAAPSSGIGTYCNPFDIEYRHSLKSYEIADRISYRSGADPVIVNHDGEYYLFVTNSGGWWRSKDLRRWEFVVPDTWPADDMNAPAAASVRGRLFLLQSANASVPILHTTAPSTGRLEDDRLLPPLPGAAARGTPFPLQQGMLPPGPVDPDIFHDGDTDRWYLYWGSSNLYPLYGIELDHGTRVRYVGTAKELLRLHPDRYGWERRGQDHRDDPTKPFIEGACMTKYGGRYYLQYAAPGTQFNVYANGTYIGDHPLGPFTYAPYNPISYKPGGFMTGAGHGNTFKDVYGNYWNTGSGWIGVNFKYERRVVMFPAGFDQDGQLYANTRFGDFPHRLPTRKWADKNELFTGWMLLSYRKPAASSSTQVGFPASHITDENPRTFWVARSKKPGEWLTIDLQQEHDVKAVQVNFTDYKSNIFSRNSSIYTQFRMYGSKDRKTWELIADLSGETRDRPNAYVELTRPMRCRYVKYEHLYVGGENLAISDIRVFGNGIGAPPNTPTGLSVRRDADPRNAFITWAAVPGAVGYNILWGIAKDKLYQTYQVFADQGNTRELRALTVGQDYYFAIEAFNEIGVSTASEVVYCR